MKKNSILAGVLAALGSMVLFGLSYLFTKSITATVTPMALLGWRFVVAFLVINALWLAGFVKLNFAGKALAPLILVAVFQPILYYTGETVGLQLTSASESSVVIACIPVVTLLLAGLILKQRATGLQIAGIALTAAGILFIVVTQGLTATFNAGGYAFLLLAVVSYSLYSVFAEKAHSFTSLEKTYVMIALGAIVFPAVAVAESAGAGELVRLLALPFTNRDFLIAIVYLGIGCSIVAILLYNTAVSTLGSNRAASFVGVATVVAIVAGVVVLKEPFTIYQVLGSAFVLGGVYLANIPPRSETEAVPPAAVVGSSGQ